jgi:2-polyprenyl-6-hydroxyphenyl methylase/3-demethylubiquinone-9 3-methyltransferase
MPGRAQVDPHSTRIDNAYYDRLGDEWWSTTGNVSGLHAMNPARADYFQKAFEANGQSLAGLRLLDVGCGGGILSEELSRRGARVVGADRSAPSLIAAQRHAQGEGRPGYACADAGSLPFADASFDGAVSSDFLEHVHDLDLVAREMARVVKPGGVIAFDTINRTFYSKLVVIGVMEIVARRIPRHTHDAKLFIRPDELRASFSRASLAVREIRGLGPVGHPLANLAAVLRNKPLRFAVSDDTRVSYVGWAVRS